MDSLITGLLLVGLLLTPLAIVVFMYWFLRRRGLPYTAGTAGHDRLRQVVTGGHC
jgi:hypothetical protein